MQRELKHQVRGCAESREAKGRSLTKIGETERAPSDCASAKQRRRFDVGHARRNLMRERRGHREKLGVSAVDVAAGRLKVGAQIFIPRATELANTVGGIDPR